ncbi:MAG: aspartyl-tRNA(Asn)/glutamyl-tRNA(Gln) amidotransferase subunit [Thermoanaerobacteraceae bacterium]|jgi:aspartyl-tRNA(Asn)/glutamyl-tRNA(Gln) amidotransferase subunit C|nr:aspartyl-tRNA(Asn)/glutamyl-tRNA(Gln) amidotransferase subunit [Thermoanaerobacteraceae bacterium]MDN5302858.1 aspartyl-tRNA(Asn)/glutamyl-tRNA(Gln) amidotransferase subunit [Thermoanaerobacteraceae bacterium]MDN5311940.1 aspartyl-tRNA(Asn)/glutamyl-tRNA(Gln) amidotransferase subunit [Thermoanaerobacteraceae bacterium]RKL63871.1 Asp-tRNA(Asn)/Glu-tRNA(Gln) amidotransferase subunit GatC [Thermoanaerobacteraceae bacterium SP2]
MRITKETVEHVANLARLYLSEEEKAEMTEKLNSILDYMEKLNELDTSQVQPTAHVIPIKNVFREDRVWESLPLKETLKNAPDRDENFFRVPRIIEE